MSESRETAHRAYEGYATHTGGKTFDGRRMPSWEELPARIRNAWRAAVVAALKGEVAMEPGFEPEPPPADPRPDRCQSTLGELRCSKGRGHDGRHGATPATGGSLVTWPKMAGGPVGS